MLAAAVAACSKQTARVAAASRVGMWGGKAPAQPARPVQDLEMNASPGDKTLTQSVTAQ